MKGKHSEQLNDVVTVECNEDDEEDEDKDKGPCENQVLEPFNQILTLKMKRMDAFQVRQPK